MAPLHRAFCELPPRRLLGTSAPAKPTVSMGRGGHSDGPTASQHPVICGSLTGMPLVGPDDPRGAVTAHVSKATWLVVNTQMSE